LRDQELTYFAVCLLDGEVFINGIAGYFESTSSDLYETAIRGLAELGANDVSSLVLLGKSRIFGDAAVPTDLKQRQSVIRQIDEQNDDELEKELKELGRQMFALSEELGAKLEAYARQYGFWPEGAD
jgi:hypothetical protein